MTVLMHSWYYEKKDLKHTPSIVDGLDFEKENRYRREGARFIINVGTKMGLRYDTMATGVVYFHRFYMFHSFRTFPRYVTACCCLFLAGKVEETPKKCKDIIRIAKAFLTESQFAQFGDDPKEEVMTLERILLQTIKFDLQVDHPYTHLLKYAKSLKGGKGDKVKLQNMVQMAWTFINDSLCTTLCLQWEPEIIAIALMHLAGKLSKFEVLDWTGRIPGHQDWWDMFVEGMSIELLEDICHQVLDLYSMPNPKTPQDSPPATPITKQNRTSSQPPSPVEVPTSPAHIKPKDVPKDPLVGQPIPRLEPGELKRKASHIEKESHSEPAKVPRMMEGKAIPTISSCSSKNTAPKNIETSMQPSSPSPPPPPPQQETVKPTKTSIKSIKDTRPVDEPVYKTALASKPPSYVSNSYQSSDNTMSKVVAHVPQVTVTSLPPPTATYTQTAPYFSETQPFPNMQQPPPLFPQRPPVSFQHPPPVPPSGPPPPPPPGIPPPPPPHQYTPNIPPPFSSQYPPPPRMQTPNLSAPPPPTPVPGITHPPPGVPPIPSVMHNVPPPPPPGVHPMHRMSQDSPYRPGPDLFNSDQLGHSSKSGQAFGSRPPYEGNFHSRREPDFPRGPNFRRPPPSKFNQDFQRSPNPPRRFLLDHQQVRKPRPPHPPAGMGNAQQHGGPTGIAPVRITGSK